MIMEMTLENLKKIAMFHHTIAIKNRRREREIMLRHLPLPPSPGGISDGPRDNLRLGGGERRRPL